MMIKHTRQNVPSAVCLCLRCPSFILQIACISEPPAPFGIKCEKVFVNFIKRLFSVALASRRRPRSCQSGRPSWDGGRRLRGDKAELVPIKPDVVVGVYPCSSDVHHSTNRSVKELAFIAALTGPADLKAVKCFRNMIKGKSTFFFAVCTMVLFFLYFFLSSLPS